MAALRPYFSYFYTINLLKSIYHLGSTPMPDLTDADQKILTVNL